jgi:hypothetical protein
MRRWFGESMFPWLLALLLSADTDQSFEPMGRIQGTVVNGTRANEPLEDTLVVLRAGPEGALSAVAETRTDSYGKFVFKDLPLDPSTVYLPGADRHGVHYPGRRVRLNPTNELAHQTIIVYDAVEAPSPLTAQRHDIDIDVQRDLAEINETLLVANLSRATYVGKSVGDGLPVTLRLSVPPNFDRVTFRSEFYGRRFRIVDHQPITDIPWPPGERELKFAYRIPLENTAVTLRRSLDIPCRNLTLRVRGKRPSDVSCNLTISKQSDHETIFATGNEELPAGHVIELQVGVPSLPWLHYARSGSLVALVGLIFATAVAMRRRASINSSRERSG